MRNNYLGIVAWSIAAIACSASPAMSAGNATHGEAVFKSHCSLCHSVQPGKNLVGPSLFAVVGRHSCAERGFHYSEASCAANLTWTEGTLDKYLASPTGVVPGVRMAFSGLRDPTSRADLVAYLATLR